MHLPNLNNSLRDFVGLRIIVDAPDEIKALGKQAEKIIEDALDSDVVKAQIANPDVDVLTGLPFKSTTGKLDQEQKATAFTNYVNNLDQKGKSEIYLKIQCIMPDELLAQMTGEKFVTYQVNGGDGQLDKVKTRENLENLVATALSQQANFSAEDIKVYLAEIEDESLNNIAL